MAGSVTQFYEALADDHHYIFADWRRSELKAIIAERGFVNITWHRPEKTDHHRP